LSCVIAGLLRRIVMVRTTLSC